MRQRALLLPLAALAVVLFAQPAFAGAPSVPPDTTDVTATPGDCDHVLNGSSTGHLSKAFLSQTLNPNGAGAADDTLTLVWRLTSTRADDTDEVADCLWIDLDGDRTWDAGETLYKLNTVEPGPSGDPMTFVGGVLEIETTIPAPPSGSIVCNRATRSGNVTSSGPPYTDKSGYGAGQTAPCNSDDPGAQIPEVPFAVLLPLSALAMFALLHHLSARRSRPPMSRLA